MINKRDRKQEELWIDRALAGDTKAFSHLYRRYHGQVYAFCIRMLHGKADPEDTTQQVFLEAWRSLHRFEKRSLFSTWITRIAIHNCLSLLRRSHRLMLHIDADQENQKQDDCYVWMQPEESQDEQLTSKARREAICEILCQLTPKKKTVFVLSDLHGMTAPEIAGILKIPDATVRTRLFHARKEFSNVVNQNSHYKELLGA